MNVRIDGIPVTESDEDLFFVDKEVYPEENQNMAANEEYRELIKHLKTKLKQHLEDSKELSPGTAEALDLFIQKKLAEQK
ncbi:sulfatase family protein [Thermoanaerobacterium thermosaccharolyticum]|uniref:Sulfatase family protein n=1 Tax=Thermoanaerobacterium thermosaccharolyticum TaxID=1517 RepID=A0A223HX98_THETR|nr:hypothetical protein [Thermoanaerobacterium thermosaccharolyticum]AST57109.1 sulfatase family protein [Thermoanaerobacterium thermosaccharolyticum]